MAAVSNSSSIVKLSVLVVVLVAMILSESMPTATAAVSCGTVYGKLTPCMSYVSGGTGPSSSCCGGIKSLNFSLKLRSDRQAACVCLKSLAARFAGAVNYGVIGSLPKKCGVNLPYPISSSINCNRIG